MVEKIDFEEIAQITSDAQDTHAEKWAQHIVDCIHQAAKRGYAKIYTSQVTNKGFAPTLLELVAKEVKFGKVSKDVLEYAQEKDIILILADIEVLCDQPYHVVRSAVELAGVEISSDFSMSWEKRVDAAAGREEESLPF